MGWVTDKALSELLNQFEDKQNITKLFIVLSARFEDTDAMLDHLLYDRWIDTAVGVHLDVIGRIVGMERLYLQVSPANIFTYRGYLDPNVPTKGYGTVAGPGVGGVYTSIHGLFTDTPISDPVYRDWIKWKILTRNKIESIPTMYEFIDDRFSYQSVITVPITGRVRVEVPILSTASERFLMRRFMPLAAGVELELLATL